MDERVSEIAHRAPQLAAVGRNREELADERPRWKVSADGTSLPARAGDDAGHGETAYAME
ncbi:MAG TPA: hypothetical protein VI251_06325 [Pseudolabrys sp.]